MKDGLCPPCRGDSFIRHDVPEADDIESPAAAALDPEPEDVPAMDPGPRFTFETLGGLAKWTEPAPADEPQTEEQNATADAVAALPPAKPDGKGLQLELF